MRGSNTMIPGAGLMLAAFAFTSGNTALAAPLDVPIVLAMRSQPLSTALRDFSEQTGVQFAVLAELTDDKTAPELNGQFELTTALGMLLEGSGLAAYAVNDNTFGIRASEGGTTDDHGDRIPEVMVTARRRTEDLQDVPSSIAAATAETLDDLNVQGVTELDAIAPGLTFVSNPSRFGTGPSIALRGVSTQTQSMGVQDSVGIVIDGVVIARAKPGSFPDLADTNRVEVLRGPQGTLFGKNASAGVISITTKDPTPDFESELSLAYGSYDQMTVRGSLTGTLVKDRLLGRVSAFSRQRDGYVENIQDGSKWEDDEQKGFRSKLLWTLSDADELKFSMDFTEQKNGGGAIAVRALTPASPAYILQYSGALAGLENDKINAPSLGSNRHRTGGVSAEWNHSWENHTLTSITAYRQFEQRYRSMTYGAYAPIEDLLQYGGHDMEQYSQEIRLVSAQGKPVEYVAGVFLLSDSNEVGTAFSNYHSPPVTGPAFARDYESDTDALNYAAFAEVDVHPLDALTLTGGLRWTHEKVDVQINGYPILAGQIRSGHPTGVTRDSRTASDLSWKVGAQWQIDSDRMLYASLSTGYKGPGFNVNTSVLGDAQPINEETVISYELGSKSEFIAGRLLLNVSAYWSEFEDFQTQGVIFPSGPTLPGQIVLLNAGEMRTRGVEAELRALIADNTEISLNGAYIDATFQDFPNAPCNATQTRGQGKCTAAGTQDLAGARLPNSPELSFNALIKQNFDIPRIGARGFATVDYSWRDDVQWDIFQNPNSIEGSYGLLGASLGVAGDSGRFNAKLYGKNLTDRFHTSGIVSSAGIVGHFLPLDYRRLFGVDVSFKY